MKNASNREKSQRRINEEATSFLSDEFEDNVMEDIQQIVLKRQIKRDRILSMMFTFFACLAILLFCIVFSEIGLEMLPLTAKRFYLLIQGIMVSAIIFLIQMLIKSNTDIRHLSSRTI